MSEKLQSLTGLPDLLPEITPLWRKLERACHDICANHGFSEIRTPLLEPTTLFARGIGEDTQVVQKEMYTFEDRGGDSVTLRPEGTAGVVRAYVEHSLAAKDEINKLYYTGPMFRYERPQKGRQRQFHQIGAEIFGTLSPEADAEIVILADRIVKTVGIKNYTLVVNSLGTKSERAPYLEKLTAFFTDVKGSLCADCQSRLERKNPLRIFDCKNEACGKIASGAPLINEFWGEETKQHFEIFKTAIARAGLQFTLAPRLVRGLDYYERTAFEFVSDQLGAQSAFAGGGRYDGLVEELGGAPTPAVGFGMGMERVILLMQANSTETATPSGVYLAGLSPAGLVKARELVVALRDAGKRAEAGYEAKSPKSQLRRANKLGFAHVILIGDDELSRNSAAVKNLIDGTQTDIPFAELLRAQF